MGAGRKTQPISPNSVVSSVCGKNLGKHELGGVIFGCKNNTMKECLYKQLFGLPAQHFSYVKNIDPGLPLFLFNYSDRKLHGIFEAASKGQMYIDPYAWAADCSERTQYPAQVQIRVRLQCQPLSEDTFGQVIADNYYTHNHFWFELDHRQTSKLMSLLVSLAIAPGTSVPQSTMKWRTVCQSLPSHKNPKEGEAFKTIESETENFTCPNSRTDCPGITSSLDGNIQTLDTHTVVKEVKEDEKNLIYMKLKELALGHQSQDLSLSDNVNHTPDENNTCSVEKSYLGAPTGLEKKEESSSPPFEYHYTIAQLMQEVEELTAFKEIQTQKNCYLDQKLMEAGLEIQHLKNRCTMLESAFSLPQAHVEKTAIQSSAELHLDPKESLFLIGGFDGESWLSAMDLYCPSRNVIKSLLPMSSVRAYASVVQLNGELYVFGGGNGYLWYDTVESYNPFHNKWTLCPSLNQKKGSLAGVCINNRIFAAGGGNEVECFSDVEMLNLDIGRWISTCSMLDKRFALAAVELNGVLYATGGYNGIDYLRSAERFDPREHSWTKIPNMNTKRGCHSLVVLNEKLYAIGGFDGRTMFGSIEVFDPRLGAWMMGEVMNHPRGHFAAAVVKESIYVIGGVKVGENIVDTVENYREGQGWQETCTTAVGKRCFLSAIAL